MLKTGRGTTYDAPWWDVLGGRLDIPAGPIDYTDWKAVATRVSDMLWERIERIGEVETKAGKGFPLWNALQPQAARLYNEIHALPHWLLASPGDDAPRARQYAYDAACLLEQSDDALSELGVRVPRPLETAGSGGGWLGPAILLAVVGVGIYYAERGNADG